MLNLVDLLDSWELALRAEHKSPATVDSYRTGVAQFLAWCTTHGRPTELTRANVTAFTGGLLAAGAEPTTAKLRQLAVRRFSAWLRDEGETTEDQLVGLRAPKLDAKIVHPLTDEQVKALINACHGPDIFARRDEAIVRLMIETGARAGEITAMTVADVDLRAGTAVIRRGKGARGRVIPFGPQTTRAIDRYLRARKAHKLAHTTTLWLGDHGLTFAYSALWKALGRRAAAAGIANFYPHRLRHTAAHRWLAAGGSEGGLMAVAGWSTPAMLHRYAQAQASTRAATEARRLNLGDL